MTKRMQGYRRAAGLNEDRKRGPRKKTIWQLVKRAFSYERSTGIVEVSTVPFVTERWKKGKREINAFMVSLPDWIPEDKIVEAINLGFRFLVE